MKQIQIRTVILLGAMQLLAANCLAENLPNAIQFVAGVTQLAELCAATNPSMQDAPQRLLDGLQPEQRAMVVRTMASPEYPAVAHEARQFLKNLPAETVAHNCRMLYN